MKVLYAILNMGLGHATRSLPVIRELVRRNAFVTILSSGGSLHFLKEELKNETEIRFIDFPDYNISYSRIWPAYLMTLLQGHRILRGIESEQQFLKELLKQEKFDIIISDHRYGFYHESIPSFFISHQIVLQPPVNLKTLRHFSYRFHSRFFSQYHSIIIPDFESFPNLSGDLSHNLPDNPFSLFYPGPLISLKPSLENSLNNNGILILISGPEPQRTVFEETVKTIAHQLPPETTVILGKPTENENYLLGNCRFLSHLPREKLQELFASVDLIIARSGYTTLMELAALKKAAVLIPTPGQTEQIYLANYWNDNGWAYKLEQKHLSELPRIITRAMKNPRIPPFDFDPESIVIKLVDYMEVFANEGVRKQ